MEADQILELNDFGFRDLPSQVSMGASPYSCNLNLNNGNHAMFEGNVDVASQSHVVGWATENGTPCEVIVAYGSIRQTAYPNMIRPDLLAAGMPAEAGFTYTLPEPLAVEEELRVFFRDGSELRGSPCRLHQPRLRELLDGINPSAIGLEFGPLDRPILSKSRYRVDYVDHATREELIAKYAHSGSVETVNTNRIVHVDVVWPGGSLLERVPPGRQYDYGLASHVIEHVPDMIGWLQQVSSILIVGGILNLAIPDKRRTFDWRREITQLPTLIAAYVEGRSRPGAVQIFDHIAYALQIGLKAEPDLKQGLRAAIAAESGSYVDVHCWVFTDTSFVKIMSEIADLGLTDFKLRHFFNTRLEANEFVVQLEKTTKSAECIAKSYAVYSK